MQLKKLLQGSAFALVAAACAIAAPSVAKAADGAFTDTGITGVKVDGTKAEMTVTTSAKEVLVGFGKVNAKKGTIAVASWDSYEPGSNGVTVDLSKLSNTKDNYIALSTPGKGDEVSIVKIPAVAKVTKAKFDVATGKLQAGSGANAAAAAPVALTESGNDATAKLYEYRNAYGSWKDVQGASDNSAVDLSLYQEEGAKIVVRLKGKADSNNLSQQSADEAYSYGTSTTKAKVYVSSTLPGKEVKVSIPAKAKGPKATADYANGTVKFPKNSEYRLATSTALQAAGQDGKYKAGSTTAVTIADLTDGVNEVSSAATFDVEVRTVATDKKAASKWSRLSVTKPAGFASGLLTASNNQSGKTNGALPNQTTSEQKGGDTGIKTATLKEDLSGSSVLAINYITKGKLDATKFYTANAFEIENKGTKTYEVVTAASTAQSAPTDVKATKIAPGKKVAFTKIDDGASVWIRIAGDKKTATWVGAYEKLGVVDYPFTVPAQAQAGN